jgi:hypothetical protein
VTDSRRLVDELDSSCNLRRDDGVGVLDHRLHRTAHLSALPQDDA